MFFFYLVKKSNVQKDGEHREDDQRVDLAILRFAIIYTPNIFVVWVAKFGGDKTGITVDPIQYFLGHVLEH